MKLWAYYYIIIFQYRKCACRAGDLQKSVSDRAAIYLTYSMQTGNLHITSENVHQRTLPSTGRTHYGGQMSGAEKTAYAFQYCPLS